jgi:glycosyltransferase involved in cell wall biosynthesis
VTGATPGRDGRDILIVTNFVRFPARWRSSSGAEGEAVIVDSVRDFLKFSRRADLVIVNCNVSLAMKLRAAYMLLPFLRVPILGHDIVLRKPLTLKARLTRPLKAFLLSRIDHYSLHFRDLTGYTKYFGIRPEKVSYVPFKPSVKDRDVFTVTPDGDYILCLGWSERDYDTFFAAMDRLPYPAAIPRPDFSNLAEHSSRFTRPLAQLPPNVTLMEDDLSTTAMTKMIEGARLVVLPTVAARINASGIGTYLNAMFMGKCVITSDGPGGGDVLTGGEALLVPTEDPAALAEMIQKAWEDDELRVRTARIGREYASGLGGEPELRQRVLDIAIENLVSPSRSRA